MKALGLFFTARANTSLAFGSCTPGDAHQVGAHRSFVHRSSTAFSGIQGK